jgi:hypothetical protein
MLRYTTFPVLLIELGSERGAITCTPRIYEAFLGDSRHKQRASKNANKFYIFLSLKVMIQVTTQLYQNNQKALKMQCRYT